MTSSTRSNRATNTPPGFGTGTVADAMRPGVMSCPPEASATTVARMMATHHIHAVVLNGLDIDPVRGDQLIWGVVSDMDLIRAAREGISDLTAFDLAATEPLTVAPSLSLDAAARLMDEHRVSHLIVVEDERPVGVISTLDLAGVLARGDASAAEF
jgi:CBS domain-containing protein